MHIAALLRRVLFAKAFIGDSQQAQDDGRSEPIPQKTLRRVGAMPNRI